MLTANELKVKQLRFLNKTINRFNSTNRGNNVDWEGEETGCSYTAGCAIGVEISKKLRKDLDSRDGTSVNCDSTFNKLPKHLKELTQEFLHRIQRLHDQADAWNEKGLSSYGKNVADDIKTKFGLNGVKV